MYQEYENLVWENLQYQDPIRGKPKPRGCGRLILVVGVLFLWTFETIATLSSMAPNIFVTASPLDGVLAPVTVFDYCYLGWALSFYFMYKVISYVRSKFNYVVIKVGDKRVWLRTPSTPWEWATFAAAAGALLLALWQYKNYSHARFEARVEKRKLLDQKWKKFKSVMIFFGLAPLAFLGNSFEDILLVIRSVLAAYRDSKCATDLISDVCDLSNFVWGDEDQDEPVKRYCPDCGDKVSRCKCERIYEVCGKCGRSNEGACDCAKFQNKFINFVKSTMSLEDEKQVVAEANENFRNGDPMEKIDDLLARGQKDRSGLGWFSKKPIDVWARVKSRILRCYFSIFDWVVGNKVIVIGAVGCLAAIILLFYKRKSFWENAKKKKKKMNKNVRQASSDNANPNHKQHEVSGQKTKDDRVSFEPKGLSGYEQIRPGHAAMKIPTTYLARSTDKLGAIGYVTCVMRGECVLVPRHAVVGSVLVEVCIDKNWVSLDKMSYNSKHIPDQCWFKIPSGVGKVFKLDNSYTYRAPIKGELAALYWRDTNFGFRSSIGVIGDQVVYGANKDIVSVEFDSTTLSGACGGPLVSARDGAILGFHAIGNASGSVKPKFFPVGPSWDEEFIKFSQSKKTYDVSLESSVSDHKAFSEALGIPLN
jgi:hypothetical protein